MNWAKKQWICLTAVIYLLSGCVIGQKVQPTASPAPYSLTPPARTFVPWSGGLYQNADFSLEVPAGWSLTEGSALPPKNAENYMGLNFKILAELSSNTYLPRVAITNRDLPAGTTMEQLFDDTYNGIIDQIRNLDFTHRGVVGDLDALACRYDRPWGEPWYSFQDTWVEDNSRIFMISCQFKVKPSDADRKGCESVLASLKFR